VRKPCQEFVKNPVESGYSVDSRDSTVEMNTPQVASEKQLATLSRERMERARLANSRLLRERNCRRNIYLRKGFWSVADVLRTLRLLHLIPLRVLE
jgi:hypothetical protein